MDTLTLQRTPQEWNPSNIGLRMLSPDAMLCLEVPIVQISLETKMLILERPCDVYSAKIYTLPETKTDTLAL